MIKKLFLIFALVASLVLAAAPFVGCGAPVDGGIDLPVITSGPDAAATESSETEPPVTEKPVEETLIPLMTAPPTESASEAPTEAPTPNPTSAPQPAVTPEPTQRPTEAPTQCPVSEDGRYDSKDEVALYIHLFGRLPDNYITKKEANAKGWSGGSLEPYAPGCSIGGDYFGNYENKLPKKQGRKYYECDIGTMGKSSRGAKRIVFSNDGLIYYSGDHYEHFTLLYGGN